MNRGLIVGKFYPPHKGHSFLIETALKQCDDLAIIVCVKKEETITGKLRAEWLQELHPQARVPPSATRSGWGRSTRRLDFRSV
jgi:cytidyltransferase-like protein